MCHPAHAARFPCCSQQTATAALGLACEWQAKAVLQKVKSTKRRPSSSAMRRTSLGSEPATPVDPQDHVADRSRRRLCSFGTETLGLDLSTCLESEAAMGKAILQSVFQGSPSRASADLTASTLLLLGDKPGIAEAFHRRPPSATGTTTPGDVSDRVASSTTGHGFGPPNSKTSHDIDGDSRQASDPEAEGGDSALMPAAHGAAPRPSPSPPQRNPSQDQQQERSSPAQAASTMAARRPVAPDSAPRRKPPVAKSVRVLVAGESRPAC